MKKFLIALVASTVIASSASAHVTVEDVDAVRAYTYERYVKEFGKPHRTVTEHKRRRALFEATKAKVLKHNAEGHSWKMGINRFADQAPEEYEQMRNKAYGAVKASGAGLKSRRRVAEGTGKVPLPKRVDYRTALPPVLTAVKDQGQCGSCWAHSSTETMESHWAIANGGLFDLSQQQITSCTPNPDQCGGTGGCMGATHELAYDYATNAGGVTEEWVFPYQSYWGTWPACNFSDQPHAAFDGYVQVKSNDITGLYEGLLNGPMSVMVDASEWNTYSSGIYAGCSYAKNISLDHGVQLVGYGVDPTLGLNYWVIRNSWNPTFGEAGFIRILRAADGESEACGWNVDPWNGSACKGQTAPQWACGMCGVGFDATYPIAKVASYH
jgi:cathepsin L